MQPTAGPVADRPEELEGTLERVVYANEENAWSVVRLAVAGAREPVTAVGNLLGVQPGESLRLTGSWIDDPRHGRQFRVVSYATVVPATAKGIERYLGSGLIRGIGRVMARRWGKQMDSIRECVSVAAAKLFLTTSFFQMFPEHRCGSKCGPTQGRRGVRY